MLSHKSIFYLNILDLPCANIEIPSVDFDSIITMPSNDFQKLIRDMHNLSSYLEITSQGNKLYLRCKGDFAEQTTEIEQVEDGNQGVEFQSNNTEIIQGVFALKHLFLFTKCTNLCPSIELYLKNDYPIIIKYLVGSMGEIRMCLAPTIDKEI